MDIVRMLQQMVLINFRMHPGIMRAAAGKDLDLMPQIDDTGYLVEDKGLSQSRKRINNNGNLHESGPVRFRCTHMAVEIMRHSWGGEACNS